MTETPAARMIDPDMTPNIDDAGFQERFRELIAKAAEERKDYEAKRARLEEIEGELFRLKEERRTLEFAPYSVNGARLELDRALNDEIKRIANAAPQPDEP